MPITLKTRSRLSEAGPSCLALCFPGFSAISVRKLVRSQNQSTSIRCWIGRLTNVGNKRDAEPRLQSAAKTKNPYIQGDLYHHFGRVFNDRYSDRPCQASELRIWSRRLKK
jgi:hypothetical protein